MSLLEYPREREELSRERRPDWRILLSNAAYGYAMKALCNPSLSIRRMRRNFELFAGTSPGRLERKFPFSEFKPLAIGALRAESVVAMPNPQRTILYLHGGGYVFGSIDTYRRRALKLSYRCRARVVMPEYRLAPEHPFPAALDDALAAWQYINSPQCAAAQSGALFVAGDSAGGGLALSLAAALRDRGAPPPLGIIALSPWTDLAATGSSIEANRGTDCWLEKEHLKRWSDCYRGPFEAAHPGVSPLYADLAGFPPLLLLAGDRELLLDDTRRFAQKARAAGVIVCEEIGRHMQHDWPLTLPWLSASKQAWRTIARFVDEPACVVGQIPGRRV